MLLTFLVSCLIGVRQHISYDTVSQIFSPEEVVLTTVSLGERTIRLIGPVAPVTETDSGLEFKARVDTGASRCSLHVEEWEIKDPQNSMAENVGKTIRFRLENRRGESKWLSRQVAEVALVRTSEDEEMRYLVPLSLSHQGVEREVLVSLNDRSKMNYAMLLGRNYLEGEFVVDVSRDGVDEKLLAAKP